MRRLRLVILHTIVSMLRHHVEVSKCAGTAPAINITLAQTGATLAVSKLHPSVVRLVGEDVVMMFAMMFVFARRDKLQANPKSPKRPLDWISRHRR